MPPPASSGPAAPAAMPSKPAKASNRFVLVELCRTPANRAAHRPTAPYATWRDTVAPVMAEPRAAPKFVNCFPPPGTGG